MEESVFFVGIQKQLTVKGNIIVKAKSKEDALETVINKIATGKLKTTEGSWDTPEYLDFSLEITGEVDGEYLGDGSED